MYCFSVTR